ncbi:hypothetical protein L2E82_43401 [Cichorium intybus]|uniref:Uncharacterized protein n=1 Tax=Cichorium intybus TaxID=13427 RepID=A0ACB8ZPG8_CICIN|nr:hypothetical protein L2E82_43401 [Cichorium intybus]
MVWGLFPDDPLPGEESYYIFSKGTYKVGRKGCDIIVNKDKGVSRIHAEIIIDAMISIDNIKKKSSVKSSKIRIKDCSKYGTFIKKPIGSKEKVHEFPNKETTIDDSDLVSFGTGNATYRLEFIPIMFFLCGFEPTRSKELQEKISSIGASMTNKWSPNCTHVVLDDNASVNGDIIDAIMSKKHLVSYKWIESLAEKHIDTKIPSCSSNSPTLTFEGDLVKVVDPESRENCLSGYTFLLEPSEKYKIKEKLQPLLETFGAKIVPVEEFIPHSQDLEEDENNHVVHVIEEDGSKCTRNLGSLNKVTEINLIFATLSGHLDPVVFVSPPVHATSSCSTDETVVADSEPEIEIISVSTSSTIQKLESIEDEKEKVSVQSKVEETIVHSIDPIKIDNYINIATNDTKDDEIITQNGISDVIFSQDLIIRDTNLQSSVPSPTKNQVLDFKRFKKMETQSGNSFHNLVPFSKNPYKGSEYENEGVAESLKEERKRKQTEAIAEDLFNNAKAKKRGVAGFIQGLFNRR